MKTMLFSALLFGALLTNTTTAQDCQPIVEVSTFETGTKLEISSMAIVGDTLLFLEEKKHGLYLHAAQTYALLHKIKLPLQKGQEIEGMVDYHGRYLFLLDEQDKESSILVYDRQMKKMLGKKDAGKLNEWQSTFSKKGVEGIAINSAQKYCYVLSEHDKSILTFQIADDLSLTPIGNPQKICIDTTWKRCTDLFFDETNRQLYVLKNSYKKNPDAARYVIDVVSLDEKGLVIPAQSASLNKIYLDVSACAKKDLTKYNSNLEGMIVWMNTFYLVSDDYYDDKDKGLKTIFFRKQHP